MHFNVKLFFCTAWQVNLVKGPSVIFLLSAGHHVAGGIPSVTMCPALLPFFMWSFYPSFYVTCLLRPQFFLRRNWSLCRCGSSVEVGGGVSTLPSSHNLLFYEFFLKSKKCYPAFFSKPHKMQSCELTCCEGAHQPGERSPGNRETPSQL